MGGDVGLDVFMPVFGSGVERREHRAFHVYLDAVGFPLRGFGLLLDGRGGRGDKEEEE